MTKQPFAVSHSIAVRFIQVFSCNDGAEMKQSLLFTVVCFLYFGFSLTNLSADIVEYGGLNIIRDQNNASNGLAFLDTSYSLDMTREEAFANAQMSFSDARFATPTEFNDLFYAAGLSFNGTLTAADGFSTGANFSTISSGSNYSTYLLEVLGPTSGSDYLVLWTDPDASSNSKSTRDYLEMTSAASGIGQTTLTPNSYHEAGWLIVTAVPEPSTGWVYLASSLAIFCLRRRGRPCCNRN